MFALNYLSFLKKLIDPPSSSSIPFETKRNVCCCHEAPVLHTLVFFVTFVCWVEELLSKISENFEYSWIGVKYPGFCMFVRFGLLLTHCLDSPGLMKLWTDQQWICMTFPTTESSGSRDTNLCSFCHNECHCYESEVHSSICTFE